MNTKVVAGIDIGGTKIAVALQNFEGDQLAARRLPTRIELGPHRILEDIFQNIEAMLEQTETTLVAVGIGCPGPIDIERGLVMGPANLPDWVEFPIVELTKERFSVMTIFDNDANAAGLGEYFYGAGKGFKDVFYVTISTGIGGAIIFDGNIRHGVGASAGEIGHTIVIPDGFLCGCGTRGCLETISSGLNIARRMREKLAENNGQNAESFAHITAETVVEAVKKGDKTALAVWEETCKYLAVSLGNAITLIAPEAVVIGGGVSAAGELLLEPVRRLINQNVKMLPIEKVAIRQSSLGSESGVCGALMMAQQAYQKNQINVK